jgi:hypothetical protein
VRALRLPQTNARVLDEGVPHEYSVGVTRDGAVTCACERTIVGSISCSDAVRASTLELHGCRATVQGTQRRARVMEGSHGMRGALASARTPTGR